MPLCGYNSEMAHGISQFAEGIATKGKGDMSFCGHNDTMARGLAAFGDGLAVQTNKRAADEKVPLTQIPAIELSELDIMVDTLARSHKRVELEGILGLGLFVRHLYRRLQQMQASNPGVSAEEAFKVITAETNELLFAMEENYYENLRPNHPREKAIALITAYLEGKV